MQYLEYDVLARNEEATVNLREPLPFETMQKSVSECIRAAVSSGNGTKEIDPTFLVVSAWVHVLLMNPSTNCAIDAPWRLMHRALADERGDPALHFNPSSTCCSYMCQAIKGTLPSPTVCVQCVLRVVDMPEDYLFLFSQASCGLDGFLYPGTKQRGCVVHLAKSLFNYATSPTKNSSEIPLMSSDCVMHLVHALRMCLTPTEKPAQVQHHTNSFEPGTGMRSLASGNGGQSINRNETMPHSKVPGTLGRGSNGSDPLHPFAIGHGDINPFDSRVGNAAMLVGPDCFHLRGNSRQGTALPPDTFDPSFHVAVPRFDPIGPVADTYDMFPRNPPTFSLSSGRPHGALFPSMNR